MALTKPTEIPRWADTGSITTPPEGKKDLGWIVDEKPPAQFENWIQNRTGSWVKWIDERVFDGATSSDFTMRAPVDEAGDLLLLAGDEAAAGIGGDVQVTAGASTGTDQPAGDVVISAGSSTGAATGKVEILGTRASGSGTGANTPEVMLTVGTSGGGIIAAGDVLSQQTPAGSDSVISVFAAGADDSQLTLANASDTFELRADVASNRLQIGLQGNPDRLEIDNATSVFLDNNTLTQTAAAGADSRLEAVSSGAGDSVLELETAGVDFELRADQATTSLQIGTAGNPDRLVMNATTGITLDNNTLTQTAVAGADSRLEAVSSGAGDSVLELETAGVDFEIRADQATTSLQVGTTGNPDRLVMNATTGVTLDNNTITQTSAGGDSVVTLATPSGTNDARFEMDAVGLRRWHIGSDRATDALFLGHSTRADRLQIFGATLTMALDNNQLTQASDSGNDSIIKVSTQAGVDDAAFQFETNGQTNWELSTVRASGGAKWGPVGSSVGVRILSDGASEVEGSTSATVDQVLTLRNATGNANAGGILFEQASNADQARIYATTSSDLVFQTDTGGGLVNVAQFNSSGDFVHTGRYLSNTQSIAMIVNPTAGTPVNDDVAVSHDHVGAGLKMNANENVIVPFILPVGATITRVRWRINRTSALLATMRFREKLFSATVAAVGTQIAVEASPAAMGDHLFDTDDTAPLSTTRDATATYWVEFASAGALTIGLGEVTYTLSDITAWY